MVNAVTRRYVEECLTGGTALRDAVRRAPFSPAFLKAYRGRLVDRPWFVDESALRGFADDLGALLDLLVTLPNRLFDGDLEKYCAALGIDERRARIICRDGSAAPPRYARPDVYFDGTAFKLLEFNICSSLGGIDHSAINSALLRDDAFREFADEHRLGYQDTAQEVARALHKVAAPVATGDRPVVAMVERKGGVAAYLHRMRVFQEVMGAAGLDVRLAEVGQFTTKGGKLVLDGTPIDMVLRYFTLDEICEDPSGEEALEPILRADDSGKTILYTPLRTYLYTNKGCLALLSDPGLRSAFSAEESALIDRTLPLTRTLVDGPVRIGGETVDLIEYCRANRETLILKPRSGFGGFGAVPGWATSDQEWRQALASPPDLGYIVQERVTPRPEPVCDPETGSVDDWIAVWSFFLTEEGYAGSSFLRAIPADAGALISAELRARTTSVFTYPSSEPAA